MVKSTIYKGCEMYNVDSINDDHVTQCAKEVLREADERQRVEEKTQGNGEAKEKTNRGGEGEGKSNGKASSKKSSRQQQQSDTAGDNNGDGGGEDDDDDADDDDKATKALRLAERHCAEIFVNEFNRPFAAMRMTDGHVEVHSMQESKFKNWIQGLFHQEYDQLLSKDALEKIVTILQYQADFDSSIPRHNLDVRVRGYNSKTGKGLESGVGLGHNEDNDDDDDSMGVGGVGYVGIYAEIMEDFDTIYYDLTNKRWQAVKITSKGWEIDSHPPYLFRKYGSEIPQMKPDRNYKTTVLTEWLSLFNLRPETKDTQELLLKGRIISEFWPTTATAKPPIILPSSQGSGKTTAFELERDLIDPNMALTLSLPKDDNQLKQLLSHNYIVRFDNLSYLTDEQSNIICRSVTGAGDFKRELYKNDEDIIYKYKRSVGLNGITNVATRPDLSERGLFFEFADIPKTKRELLRVIWRNHLELKPKVLAFCLDVISEVMAEREKWKTTDPDYFGLKDVIMANGGLPRMADWIILGEQIAAVLARKEAWPEPYVPGTFLKAYEANQELLNMEALKASLVAEALIAFMYNRSIIHKKDTWEGSATLLLAELNEFIAYNSESVKINIRAKAWPQDPAALGRDIARIRPNIRALGIEIEYHRTKHNVQYFVRKLPTSPTPPTPSDSNNNNFEGQNHEEKGDSGQKGVGSVGGVGESSAKLSMTDLLLDQITQRLVKEDKDYFTEDDWTYQCSVWPNLNWDIDHAKEALNQLLLEGKIKELESGKYQQHQPDTEELNQREDS
jgi:hypothetical protein